MARSSIESALIKESKRGNRNAFGRLVNLYIPRIQRLSRSVCSGLPAEAEDVFQEAFLKALKNIRQFKEQSDFGTWLYRIASNLCWKRFREKKMKPVVPFVTSREDRTEWELPDRLPTPDVHAEKNELRCIIGTALESLPEDFRSVLLMSDLNDWSNARIGKELGLSVAAVKSRLHRARSLLKKSLLTYHK